MRNLEVELKELLLGDIDILTQTVSEINGWNGSLDNLRVEENDEDFFNTYFEGRPMEVARATFYGDYKFNDEYVRFNAYGNLESLTGWEYEQELKDSIDDIVESLIYEYDNLSLHEDIEELWNEIETEKEEE